ncbi:MAG TPA: peptidylprolyl isomerase [Thermoanaerobaculia bacterium]|nr:peptidylprolyl isomerase [Thermoanaerobaculia bacterium]
MLKVLRENVKYLSWILWVIIAIFVLFVFVDFGAGVGNRGQGQGPAITVGEQKITMRELQRVQRRVVEQARQAYGDQFTPEVEKRLEVQTVSEMVDQKILLAEARRMGLAATDADVRDRILSLPLFKDDQGRFVGEQRYVERVRQMGFTADEFERELRDEVLYQRLMDVLKANLFVPEEAVEKAYRDQVEKAKIRYVQVPRNLDLAGQAIPETEVAAYFAAHKDEFKLPEQRDVAYLLVDSGKLLAQVKEDEGAIKAYYDTHPKEFTQDEQVHARHILVMVNDKRSDPEAKKRIEEAQKRIAGGDDFAKVAGEVSDDPGSKAKGGDLGFFGRNRMVKEFEDAAFAAEPHKLVGPIHSSFGYHLLEVLDRRPAGLQPYAEARQQIAAKLSMQRVQSLAEGKAKAAAERLAKDKPKGPEGLEALAKEDPLLTFDSAKFGKDDFIPGLGRSQPFSTAAFGLQKGQVSPPIQVPRGWAILYLKDIVPPRVPELAEVEPKVRVAVANRKQEQLAMDRLNQIKQQVAGGKTLDQAAAALGLQAKESQEFGGTGMVPGLGFNPQLAQAALALQPGQVGGPVADAQGAILFQVIDHKGWDPKLFAAAREQTRSRLEGEKLQRLLSAMVEQRKRDLGVTYDPQLLESLGLGGDASRKS